MDPDRMRCPACGHVRTRLDPLPDTHCPDCGIEYADSQRKLEAGLLERLPEPGRRRPGLGVKSAVVILAPLVVIAAGWYLVLTPAAGPIAQQPEAAVTLKGSIQSPQAQPRVVMYATAWCPYCAKARTFFSRNGIQYVEHDIEQDASANAAHSKLGRRGVPIIVVGDTIVDGYHEQRLRSLLRPWLSKPSG